jgi:glycosyltransferase involved in cell wall biosynthesis
MIVFDSNNKSKWSGRGFAINGKILVAYKNANFRHKIPLGAGKYSIRIFAKNRTGSSPLLYKIVTERNIVLASGKIILSKTWSEDTFDFDIPKNYGLGYLYIYREQASFGSSEIGRLIVEKEESVAIKNRNQSRFKQSKPLDADIISPRRFIKKKVGFVIPYPIYGGAEVYLETLINNIDPKMFQMHLIYLKDNPLRFSLANKSVIHKKISSLDNFANYLKNQELDVIVYYNSLNAYRLIQKNLNSLKKKPKLVEIYHSDFKWADSLSSLNKRHNIDIAFKVAPDLLSDVKGIKQQIHLPVPLDIEKFCIRDIDEVKNVKLNLPNKKKIIGVVARLSAEKNLSYVLDIAEQAQDFNFLIFGEGNQEQALRKIMTIKKLDNVFLIGFKKDIFRYYGIFDAFLLTSKMEGTPISILEAMASGVPVFTTNVGQISSIVKDGETGFFLSNIAQNDTQLIRDNIFNQDVILNARRYIEETHDQEVVTAKFVNSIVDVQNQFIKKGKMKLLQGEYI